MNTSTPRHRSLPRSLLVAYDAESMADHAVLQAVELARLFDARLDVVHAFGSVAFAGEVRADPREVARGHDPIDRANEAMRTRLAGLLGEKRGGRARADELLHVVPGQPAQVLLERAKAIRADLIVMGALRRRPVFDFGSTARTVLARSGCSVWIQPCPPTPIHSLLVAVDLSAESLRALDFAVEIAERVGGHVRALHAFDMTPLVADPWGGMGGLAAIDEMRRLSCTDFLSAMKSYDWRDVAHDVLTEDGPPAQRILDHARERDLVLMGTHGRTGFSAAVLGSVAYDVLRHSSRPVFVVRDPDRRFVGD